nr:unnamed protein product [Digitaria exilis]
MEGGRERERRNMHPEETHFNFPSTTRSRTRARKEEGPGVFSRQQGAVTGFLFSPPHAAPLLSFLLFDNDILPSLIARLLDAMVVVREEEEERAGWRS